MKQVLIEILPDGSIQLEAKNFKGADCEKATKALEAALGETTGRKKKLPDYYQANVNSNTQQA